MMTFLKIIVEMANCQEISYINVQKSTDFKSQGEREKYWACMQLEGCMQLGGGGRIGRKKESMDPWHCCDIMMKLNYLKL
jgi:hypothetical protein